MSNSAQTNQNTTTFVARYRGQTIGYFATADLAEVAIDAARAEEAREESDLRRAVMGY